MKYAIEILKIELFKIRGALRDEEKYYIHPTYEGKEIYWNNKINELKKAIKILKEWGV